MSAWRREALNHLPEFRQIIDISESPMALWIDLNFEFERAVACNDVNLQSRILKFATWCVSDASGRLPNNTSTAAAVAFYEHLPGRRENWQHFRRWLSYQEFQSLLSLFAYHLSADELAELKQSYVRS
ncbi:MAG: hypothetical protein FWC42_08345 [Proteobacteria bacterium]|nr:hypothetical protein [Pseudomonadota bacterium]